jgi:hypothetical protein
VAGEYLTIIPIADLRPGEECFFAMTEASARKAVAHGKPPTHVPVEGERRWGRYAIVLRPERAPAPGWKRDGKRLFLGDPKQPIAVAWPIDGDEHFWCADGKDGLRFGEASALMAAEDVLYAKVATITKALAR